MKHQNLYIATIIFFLLVNTAYFWEAQLGEFAMLIFLLLILYFFGLILILLGQTFFAIREKFNDRIRLILIGLMTFVLGSSFFFPRGLINFDKLERESVLIANREGAANCMTTLKLRDDNTFSEKNVCFGVTETTGTYFIKGDTIYFDKVSPGRHESEFYRYAIIKKSETKSEMYSGDLIRYRDFSDTSGVSLWIIKNELIK